MVQVLAHGAQHRRARKNTPALDIDLMDEDACEAIETLVGQLFEDGRILVRIGKAPKRLIPFRTGAPFKKLILAVTAPNGTKGKLEFLGDGQQYIRRRRAS